MLFGIGLSAFASALVLYLVWETAPFHRAVLEERIYLTAAFGVLTASLFFTGDSPLRFANRTANVASASMVFCLSLRCFVWGSFTRRFQRCAIKCNLSQRTAEALQLACAVAELESEQAARLYNVSWVLDALSGRLATRQRAFERVFRNAPSNELNSIIQAVNLARLSVSLPASFLQTIRSRLPDLDIASKAVLLDALQKLGPRRSTFLQSIISDVLLGTYGLELTALKCLVDDGGDWHSLHKLVYIDLVNNIAVLDHFASEARKVGVQGRSKIISDLDDTLFSSGGRWPAGCDSTMPSGEAYPGMFSLLRCLDNKVPNWVGGDKNCNIISGKDVLIKAEYIEGSRVGTENVNWSLEAELPCSTTIGGILPSMFAAPGAYDVRATSDGRVKVSFTLQPRMEDEPSVNAAWKKARGLVGGKAGLSLSDE